MSSEAEYRKYLLSEWHRNMLFHVERIENKLPEFSGIPDLHISGGATSDILLELKWFGTGSTAKYPFAEDVLKRLEPSQKRWFTMRRDLGASHNVFVMAGTPTAHFIYKPVLEDGPLKLELDRTVPFGGAGRILDILDEIATNAFNGTR